ncbi:MAG: FAD-binding oxidoreductase [Planctomycetales bacterium]|nr:FAD-binding oxidoreductase [Planctomycetales bacterium]
MSLLPLTKTNTSDDEADVCAAIAEASAARTPVYAIGGGTSLSFGCLPSEAGLGVRTTSLAKLIDYPARDMTITVQAGMTYAELSRLLAQENQRLPIDPPQAEQATIGGILATNTSGPRRYGCGTLRDYLIGLSAVDGRGTLFHAGGRVVKNVAGYDFCRLLIGSLGSLAVVTQATIKVIPIPERSLMLACALRSANEMETMLADLVASPIMPSAVQVLCGKSVQKVFADRWGDVRAVLAVGLEGTQAEVEWMRTSLESRWGQKRLAIERVENERGEAVWRHLSEFPAADDPALVLKAVLMPSRVADFCDLVHSLAPEAELLADGRGHVFVKFLAPLDDAAGLLIRHLHPAAIQLGGRLAVVHNAEPQGWTRQMIWGGRTEADDFVDAIRRQFDPHNILNPGRWG